MNVAREDELVSGLTIAAGQVTHCSICGACLRPNHRIEVLVDCEPERPQVVVRRCRACARGSIRPETRRDCLVARGRVLGVVGPDGHSKLILSSASVIDRS
ncbi:hypothetical protein ACFQGT_00380 [Natrialbaceae archaeon GCM10025810]